jgi:hypothetical protein
LSYVAYVTVGKVLPYVLTYVRQKCVSSFGHAIWEQVYGAVVYTPDPKGGGGLFFSNFKPRQTNFNFIGMAT